MQVTETQNQGLSRQLKVVIPAAELDDRLDKRLAEMAPQVRLNGFRPGKVPVSFLKRTYGKSLMGEIVQEAVSESSQQAIDERELKAVAQPRIEVESAVDDVIAGKADLEYTLDVDLMPEFEPVDVKDLKLERLTVEASDEAIDEQIKRLAESQQTYKARGKTAKARENDQLTIDFEGKVGGEPFEGGTGGDVKIVLGQGRFLKEFEEQLQGAKTGEERTVTLTFPEDYGAAELAGKEAEFAVTVKEVAAPEEVAIDDEFAKQLGLESLDKLKEAMKERLGQEYAQMSRTRLKRTILDKLDEAHSFELPPGMVDSEFQQIWQQVERNLESEMKAEEKTEDELKAEYRKIAERRVRLGLVLAEIGRQSEVQVTQEEIAQAIAEQARGFPGQEQTVYRYYRENPGALDQLRAPLFEDKVIDYIIERAEVTNKPVTREELVKEIEELEGDTTYSGAMPGHSHDHDHDHDHDHEHDH
jgi:trigger factor